MGVPYLSIPFDGNTPRTAEAAWIAPSAVLIGEVSLGTDASVWFHTVLRGDIKRIEVGERSNIQDNSTVHVTRELPALIGSDVTVGHGATVHGCTVGDGTLVGMGATVLDGVVVGSHSVVAAGALVPEGMAIPPCSLVMGVPAKVVRQVSEEEAERLLRQAGEYVRLAKAYRGR
ncbi:MAG: gamma carbonic anhydrase family protein [Synergistales bacterium]|nr:gamma carbonic anhydrase family protein [Synergistales bacterium]